MTRTLFFNIHDLLKIQINTGSKFDLLKDINFFLSYFEVSHLTDPDIVLNIGRFSPSNQDCFIVDHKYFIKENYFYCKDQEGRATWEVEIFGFDKGKAIINFYGKIKGIEQILFPDYLSQNLILRPLIELKLFEHNFAVIHGLGIEKDGFALIIAGRGGAHKTRIAMDALKTKKFKIIGDDRIIIGKNKMVYSYPIYHNLLRFKTEKLNDEHISSLSDTLKMASNLLFYFHKNQNIKLFSDNSTLNMMIFIARKKSENASFEQLALKDATLCLLYNSQMEMITSGISKSLGQQHFLKYLHAFSYIFPQRNIAKYWTSLMIFLKDYLKEIPIYSTDLSYDYKRNIFLELIEKWDEIYELFKSIPK